MYKKFRLIGFENEDFNDYIEKGRDIYTKENSRKKLNNFVNLNGNLSGNKIIEEWFGNGEFDIFLSHSHKDLNLALGIAGFLYEKFKLKVFIDSEVWGHADNLLKEIDDEYCKNEGDKKTYDYKKRNKSTAHVHLMLNNALTKMIDSCSLFFFLDSSNSLNYNSSIFEEDTTYSPWINSEIQIANTIRRKTPQILVSESFIPDSRKAGLENYNYIEYSLEVEEFSPLDYKKFDEISKKSETRKKFLEIIFTELD